ncbi:hypothetical protein GCM10009105_10740 [Dokdonella soli]|uniref:Uncharacterized protein n=1 Tax=Dokdonella soli TaxID=529810 RepID=A0ABN1IDZ7_9GAMM
MITGAPAGLQAAALIVDQTVDIGRGLGGSADDADGEQLGNIQGLSPGERAAGVKQGTCLRNKNDTARAEPVERANLTVSVRLGRRRRIQ